MDDYTDYETMLHYQQACRALAQRDYHTITDNHERLTVLATTLVRLFNRPDLRSLHLFCERTRLGRIGHASLHLDDQVSHDAVPESHQVYVTFTDNRVPAVFRPRMVTVPVIDEEHLLVANDYGTLYVACPQGSCFAREPKNRGLMLDAARGQMLRF